MPIMNISKRHHYNPQYYLKKFANSKKQLWRLDKESGKIVCGSSEKFGLKKNWNTLQVEQSERSADWIEGKISKIDHFAAQTLGKIVDGKLPEDIRPLCAAISFMQNHQPRLKRELIESNSKEVSDWSNDTFLIAGVKSALRDYERYVPKSYIVYEIDSSKPDWHFLTSSNPLIEFSDNSMKFFPVSKKHCMFLNNDVKLAQIGSQYFGVDSEEIVRGVNRRTVENSWQYVYSPTSDFSFV